jgi:hypothetical protein
MNAMGHFQVYAYQYAECMSHRQAGVCFPPPY